MLPLTALLNPTPESTVQPDDPDIHSMLAQEVRMSVHINRQTTLDKLYIYSSGTIVEYPETKDKGRVGHLFEMDPLQPWYNPATSFAYSLGEPKGSRGGSARAVYCNLLQDSEGNQVPCRESHATCQGCKACSYADQTVLSTPHHRVSRSHIQSRLYSENLTPSTQVLKKNTYLLGSITEKWLWNLTGPISCPITHLRPIRQQAAVAGEME
ncbi:hypothetical protein BDN67DRAFT_491414 [Paxillus ammoniavirescens]|nr:hypothetical protein BDN67DRAFT_491414 [Paxillus ammoniavirescens]